MGIFTVTKLSEGPVRPCAATPSGTLPMAWVDRYPMHRGLVESAHIYRNVADMPAPAAEREAGGTGTEADAAGAWTRRRFAPAPAPSLRGHRRCVLFLAESRALSPDGEEGDWEEVVPGAPGPGEMEEEEEYRVVFWSPPTIDEVTGAVTSIQE